MRTPATAFLIVLLSFSAASNAQYRGAMGSSWNNPVSALSNMQMWNNINGMASRRAMLKASLRKLGCSDAQMDAMHAESELMLALSRKTCNASGTSAGSSRASPGPRNPTAASTQQVAPPISFRPTGSRTVLPQIVAGITQDKSEQQALTRLIGGGIDQFEASERAKGSEYDLASAMAFFASVAIQLQDPRTEINPGGADALKFALRESLGHKVASISDGDKQQLYEALLCFGMLFALSSRNADARTQAQLKQASADTSLKLLNLDVRKYKFTSDGLAVAK